MAYDLKSFRAWATYYDVAQELPDKEQGVFYRAIFEYMFTGRDMEEELPKIARICFKSIKPNLKRSKSKSKANESYEDGAEMALSTSHENGTKIALNLNSNLNIKSKQLESGASHGETPAPSSGEKAVFPCPYCHAETVGEWSESVGKYSVNCGGCGGSYVMSAAAVELAIGKGGAA